MIHFNLKNPWFDMVLFIKLVSMIYDVFVALNVLLVLMSKVMMTLICYLCSLVYAFEDRFV
jgi:hypothetical protein